MTRLMILMALTALLTAGLAEAGAPRIGEKIDSIRLSDSSGKVVDTGLHRGKTQVVYFWNNLCGCTDQMLALKKFVSSRDKKSFAFIAINEGQSKAIVDGFIKGNRLPYEALLDSDLGIGKKKFGIKVLPTIFVIGKDGVLREKLIGIIDIRKLESIIQRHL
jgi:peroxiredoxin